MREFLDYEGVVFSDDMQMGAITKNFGLKESVVYAINAGVDVLIFSNNQVYKDLVYPEKVINIIEKVSEMVMYHSLESMNHLEEFRI